MSIGVDDESVPRYMHTDIYEAVRKEGNNLIHMIKEPLVGVVRSRTATSAGMRKVPFGEVYDNTPRDMVELGKILWSDYGISVDELKAVNRHHQEHFVDIIQDNLRGQCTEGHSCKNSTRARLEELLEYATGEKVWT